MVALLESNTDDGTFWLGVVLALVAYPILTWLSGVVMLCLVPSYRPLSAEVKIEYNSRVVSCLHAIVVSYGVYPYMDDTGAQRERCVRHRFGLVAQ